MDPTDPRQIYDQCRQYQLSGGSRLDWTCQSCRKHSSEGEGWTFTAKRIEYHIPTDKWVCERERRGYVDNNNVLPGPKKNGQGLRVSKCGSCGFVLPKDKDGKVLKSHFTYVAELGQVLCSREYD